MIPAHDPVPTRYVLMPLAPSFVIPAFRPASHGWSFGRFMIKGGKGPPKEEAALPSFTGTRTYAVRLHVCQGGISRAAGVKTAEAAALYLARPMRR